MSKTCVFCDKPVKSKRGVCCERHLVPGRSTRRTRKEAGLCIICGKGRDSTKLTCFTCRTAASMDYSLKVQVRQAEGKCVSCFGENSGSGKNCEICRSKAVLRVLERQKVLMQKGLCRSCGNMSVPERRLCRACREKARTPEKRQKLNQAISLKRRTDIQFFLRSKLRSRLYRAIKNGSKAGSAVSDLGCTVEFFKQYIEEQFTGDMSWENRGSFHLDHIKPLSAFDLTNREQFLEACHYTNMQPLTPTDNLTKSNKLNWVKQ